MNFDILQLAYSCSQQFSETKGQLVGPDESFQARPFLSTRLTAPGSPRMAVSSLLLLISFFV